MEPWIQYARTSDGVSIAYWEMGTGPALVYMPPTPRHAHLDWQHPEARQLYEWLASRHRLVRLDGRNTGLSDRAVPDLSIQARQLDLKAVADRLNLEKLILFGHGGSGSVAIGFAALNPHRVQRLILVDATVGFPDVSETPAVKSLRHLVKQDWEVYTESLDENMGGWSVENDALTFTALLKESQTWDDAKRSLSTPLYASRMLQRVTAPTLIVHHSDAIVTTIETGRHLAAQITDSRLVPLDGVAVVSSQSDPRMIEAVDEFLGESDDQRAIVPAGTVTIVFADIVDSTKLTEQLGDAPFRDLARNLDHLMRGVIRQHAGTVIEGTLLGDGLLAVFRSAREAIAAALALGQVGTDSGLQLHLGINAGDVISESDANGRNNVFGGAVNIAARIAARSAPDEVLVSAVVRSLARTSSGVKFEDRGDHALKGIGEPQHLYAVRAADTT